MYSFLTFLLFNPFRWLLILVSNLFKTLKSLFYKSRKKKLFQLLSRIVILISFFFFITSSNLFLILVHILKFCLRVQLFKNVSECHYKVPCLFMSLFMFVILKIIFVSHPKNNIFFRINFKTVIFKIKYFNFFRGLNLFKNVYSQNLALFFAVHFKILELFDVY